MDDYIDLSHRFIIQSTILTSGCDTSVRQFFQDLPLILHVSYIIIYKGN